MASKKYFKNTPIRLFNQMIALKASYPTAVCEIKGDVLWWYGQIRPTSLSREYSVFLRFTLWKTPVVCVYGDELQRLDAPDFPHNYRIDAKEKFVEICLYRHLEFSSYKFLSKTIIPWTVEWLYFYEIWLSTGEWCGGGEHPDTGESKINPGSDESSNDTSKLSTP